jgi:hypothetical protein
MFKIRFFISVAIYTAVSVILPFLIPVPMKTYFIMMGVFTLGYLVPAVLSVRNELVTAVVLWVVGAVFALVAYDYIKSQSGEGHAFFQNWERFYSTGMLILLGIQFYSRFTSELVFKQLTKR